MGTAAGMGEALDSPAQVALRWAVFAEKRALFPLDGPLAFGFRKLPSHKGALEVINVATLFEEAWLACQEPGPMLSRFYNKGRTSALRRFACACLRRVEHLLTGAAERHGLEAAEQYADRLLSPEALTAARTAVRALSGGRGPEADARRAVVAALVPDEVYVPAARATAEMTARAVAAGKRKRRAEEERIQADILRDIVYNPFRPLRMDAGWLTSEVVDLARRIDDAHEFGQLPALAEALMRAGCTSALLLDHCRAGRLHVRGCWALDAILGRR